MADNELARILASGEQPVSPMERELAARNKKLGQQTGATAGDERLARILADGGIGSDARMPVAPVMRDPVMERQIQVRTMSGSRRRSSGPTFPWWRLRKRSKVDGWPLPAPSSA
jgi:hypothetical protein